MEEEDQQQLNKSTIVEINKKCGKRKPSVECMCMPFNV